MPESSIKYGVVVLVVCVMSVAFPGVEVVATHQKSQTELDQQFRPISVEAPQENDMEKHWGVRVRG